MKRHTLLGTLLGISLMSGSSLAHIEQSEPLQSLRQSYFALLGMTFAPMGDMVKGKIEWNDALFTTWAEDLNHAAQFGVERGFAPAPIRARPGPSPTSGQTWTTSRASSTISVRRQQSLPKPRQRVTPAKVVSSSWQRAAPARPVTTSTSLRTICTEYSISSSWGPRGRLSPGPKALTTTGSGSAPPTTAAWADWPQTYRPPDPATWPE